MGYAVLPRLAGVVRPPASRALLLDPEDALPPRQLVLAWHHDRAEATEVQEFVAAVSRQAARVAEAVASAATDARRRA